MRRARQAYWLAIFEISSVFAATESAFSVKIAKLTREARVLVSPTSSHNFPSSLSILPTSTGKPASMEACSVAFRRLQVALKRLINSSASVGPQVPAA